MMADLYKFANTGMMLFLFPHGRKDAEFISSLPKLIFRGNIGIRTAGKKINRIEIAKLTWDGKIKPEIVYNLIIGNAPFELRQQLLIQLRSKGLVLPKINQVGTLSFDFEKGEVVSPPKPYFNKPRWNSR